MRVEILRCGFCTKLIRKYDRHFYGPDECPHCHSDMKFTQSGAWGFIGYTDAGVLVILDEVPA